MRVLLAPVVSAFPLFALGQTRAAGGIECCSSGYRYNYCREGSDDRVDLVRQTIGKSPGFAPEQSNRAGPGRRATP